MTVSEEFTGLTGRFRGELLVHFYRMLGSAGEAEDLVQGTYLRAGRSFAGFAGRGSVRAGRAGGGPGGAAGGGAGGAVAAAVSRRAAGRGARGSGRGGGVAGWYPAGLRRGAAVSVCSAACGADLAGRAGVAGR